MYTIRKMFKFEMAHILRDSYSTLTGEMVCPVCKKELIKNVITHCDRNGSIAHLKFIKKFDKEVFEAIDYLLPHKMQIEIIAELREILPFMSEVAIGNRIRARAKELGFNSRKVMGQTRKGGNNPVHQPGVKARIAKTVKQKWSDGYYVDRINGMLGKVGRDSPNYDPTLHTYAHQGRKYWKKFLGNFQEVDICSRCGGIDCKIDVHHIDEDHDNYLPSNLEPLCVLCHLMGNHYTKSKAPYITIGKTFYFAAAHQLPKHKGLCQFLHGHEWKIQVKIRKRIDYETGMVMDFSDLKKIVNKNVIDVLDHNTLNELLYNPTAENLLVWIWDQLMFNGLLKGIYQIDLWESKDSIASINIQDMLSGFTGEGV